MSKILIVDDEQDILDLLSYNLNKEGYDVKTARSGKEGIEIASEYQPDLIILDIMMPEMDGIETCRQIRQKDDLKDIFILFLTSRSEEYSEIAAFDAGANDFLTKPVKPRAFLSRIAAFFRRRQTQDTPELLECADLTVNREYYEVKKAGQKLNLPKKEFELLCFLMQHPGVVYNRDVLLKHIWGADVYVVPRTVDVHIRKLREKIGEGYIKTVKGIGYKFDKSES